LTLFSTVRRPPPLSTLFPYTTLFRSHVVQGQVGVVVQQDRQAELLAEIGQRPLERQRVAPLGGGRLRQLRRRRHPAPVVAGRDRSEEHTSELQSQSNLVCRLLLEKKK